MLVIETLKDTLDSMTRLLEQKEQECHRLSAQHQNILMGRINSQPEK